MAQEKKGSWFGRNWGWLLFVAGIIAGILFGLRGYKRRWRTFVTEGLARWIGKAGADQSTHPWFNKVAFMFSSAGGVKGLAEGQTIEVRDPANSGAYPTGEMKILAIHEQKDKDGKVTRWWVVTDKDLGTLKDGAHSGELRLVG